MDRSKLSRLIDSLTYGVLLKEEGAISEVDFIIDTRTMQVDMYFRPIKSIDTIKVALEIPSEGNV